MVSETRLSSVDLSAQAARALIEKLWPDGTEESWAQPMIESALRSAVQEALREQEGKLRALQPIVISVGWNSQPASREEWLNRNEVLAVCGLTALRGAP